MLLSRKLLLVVLVCSVGAQSISDSLNDFSINLLTTTSGEPGSVRNLAISPFTVWTLLSIIDEGAKGNTALQLERVLRIPPKKNNFRTQFKNLSKTIQSQDQSVNFDIHNSIYTTKQQKLSPGFQKVAQNEYNVNVQPIDFSNKQLATAKINNYIAQATRNRITNFIRPDDLNAAQIFIVSALYFKGAWKQPFNRTQTRRDTFYDEKLNKLGEVDMMYQTNYFPYARLDWIKGYSVELPYGKGDKMSMILILPYKDQSLQGMLQMMKQHPFSRIVDKLNNASIDYPEEEVEIYLPKFKVMSDLALNAVLIKMGIADVFDPSRADLMNMFPEHYLYVSHLIQRAEIEVNEEGTVASAASGAALINKIPPPKFVANRPFLYFIVNKPTKSIMFAGKITVPPSLK